MKKLISLVLVLILVCALAVSASAVGIDVSTSANTIAPGETVVVTIALEEEIPADQGATVLQGTLSYNGDALELKKVVKASKDLTTAAKHKTEDKVIFHYLSMDSAAKAFAKGQLVEITFQAKQEIDSDHAAADIRFSAAVQNAQGQDVANVTFPEAVSLVVGAAHTWDEGTVTKEPTCVAEGEMTHKCTFDGCEAVKVEKVAATGIHQWQDADCDSPKTCGACGATEGEALGHDWEPATATKAKTCKVCGQTNGKPLGLAKPVVKAASDEATGIPVLTWEAVEEADAYRIYRATSKKGKYSQIDTANALTYTDTSAKVGKTYYYKVIAAYTADESANSAYSAVVSAKAKLAQPVITVELDAASGKASISWEKITGAKKYDVYRAASETGKYSKVKTTTAASYTDTKATVGKTYFYKVKAVASSSSYNSAYSDVQSCLTICGQPAVKLSLDAATGKPVLSWKKVSGASGYVVSVADAADGPYTALEQQTALTYQDAAAPVDAERFYKVAAIAADAANHSMEAAPVSIRAACAQPAITAAADTATGKPVISWTAVEGAAEYEISRATKKTGTYAPVATSAEASFTDESAAAGKTYYYKVTAICENSRSAASAYKRVKCVCAQPVITVELNATSGKPTISWEKITGAKKYDVYRAASETGKYSKVKTTTAASYTDTKATVGKTYFYKVKAVASSSSYNSAYSDVQSCLTICGQPALKVSLNSTTGKPSLSWKKISGAKQYAIYRAYSVNGEYTLLATQTKTSYKDEAAPVDTACYYKVQAIAADAAWNSQDAAPKMIHTTCAKPVIKGTKDPATGKPMITWKEVDGAVSYEIVRSTKKNGTYTVVGTDADGSFVDSAAVKGKTYYYRVIAVCANSRSAESAYVKIKSK